MPKGKARSVAVALGVGFLLLAACGTLPESQFVGEAVRPLEAAPPLLGVNWDGEAFDMAQVQGKVTIVFFGYTFCPDVCPFTLAKLKQLKTQLGEAGSDLAVVFVSVDPFRDSVEKLADYVPKFDRDFYGIRLDMEELEEMRELWEVTIQYGEPRDGVGTDSFYYVDHTGSYFVVDKQGRLRIRHPPDSRVDQLLPDVQLLLAE